MTKRISGQSFDITMLDTAIHVEKINLTITDNTAPTQTNGVPDGYVSGDVSASGDLELDVKNFKLLSAAATAAGSWRDLPPTDILFYANSGDEEFEYKAFGCKLTIDTLPEVDPKGGSKSVSKVKFSVTSPDFVHIDGVPYLSATDTRGLIS